ncbi:MAG: bifunctional helix-turn-helix domain-containing protein/methylated-DNA--[protein]-cysteine S-methyltransferase [Pseudomonadota bacterium]
MTTTAPDPHHYQLMAAALDILDEAARAGEEPSLDMLAARMGFSPSHFQRMFSQWVGVSPKRYHQYLTLDHAKALLRERFTVLDTTYEAGLSSPGRLHDLFIRWEAMSPGTYAAKGAGLEIAWGRFDTPFGEAIAMATDRGLCGLGFTAETGEAAALADLKSRWPAATYTEHPAAVRPFLAAALGEGDTSKLVLIGAPFQIKVWEALLRVPSGHVTTYSEIARVIGAPKAVRAVGTAVGRNPISWLIPCHRALRKSGGLGGYHWGLPVKRAMLAYESARAEAGETAA